MTWVAVGGAVVGAVGSAYSGSQAKKGAKAAAAQAQQASELDWARQNQAVETNKNNQLWAQGVNQKAMDTSLGQNRIDQKNDFGSVDWEQDPTTGKWTQSASLAPEQQAMLDNLRGKQGDMIGGLESGFNVNNDVMQAMRQQSAPMMQQQRDRENARLAAMGLSTGSGVAWGNSQDSLNRSENDMNQKNILGGFNAWNAEQANSRANLGALNSTETGWKANSAQTPFNAGQMADTAMVQAPTLGGQNSAYEAGVYGANAQMDANQSAMQGYSSALGGVAGAAGKAYDWWSQPAPKAAGAVDAAAWGGASSPYSPGGSFM